MAKVFFNRQAIIKNFRERLELGARKSNDYGGSADGIAICGVEGIATRLVDKVLRVHSLTRPGADQQVKDESIRDTLKDIANYADYGVCLMDGTWGVQPPEPEDFDVDLMIQSYEENTGRKPNTIIFNGAIIPFSDFKAFTEKFRKKIPAFAEQPPNHPDCKCIPGIVADRIYRTKKQATKRKSSTTSKKKRIQPNLYATDRTKKKTSSGKSSTTKKKANIK